MPFLVLLSKNYLKQSSYNLYFTFLPYYRADILYLEKLNAMQPQRRYYDEDYAEQSGPVEKRGGNDAINRIISRLRPTYSKRPRER